MAELLKGKPVVDRMAEDMRGRIAALEEQGMKPTLALVRLGQRPDDLSYERTAVKRAAGLGIHTKPYVLDEFAPEAALKATLQSINYDKTVHGCLMFRPLPTFMDEKAMCNTLTAAKDVDGISLASLAAVFTDAPDGFPPCTAAACVAILEHYKVPIAGKHVVVIGGGDTGSDCLGTSIRQGAKDVTVLQIMPKEPSSRPDNSPWPTFARTYQKTSSMEEGGEYIYSTDSVNFEGTEEEKAKVTIDNSTTAEGFVADERGHVTGLKVVSVAPGENGPFTRQPGTERVLPADLVLISVGFLHPDTETILDQLPVELDGRGNIARNDKFATSQDGVFVCGDAGRGQSLVVWAIAEGRSCAAAVDEYLSSEQTSELPAPIKASQRPMMLPR